MPFNTTEPYKESNISFQNHSDTIQIPLAIIPPRTIQAPFKYHSNRQKHQRYCLLCVIEYYTAQQKKVIIVFNDWYYNMWGSHPNKLGIQATFISLITTTSHYAYAHFLIKKSIFTWWSHNTLCAVFDMYKNRITLSYRSNGNLSCAVMWNIGRNNWKNLFLNNDRNNLHIKLS